MIMMSDDDDDRVFLRACIDAIYMGCMVHMPQLRSASARACVHVQCDDIVARLKLYRITGWQGRPAAHTWIPAASGATGMARSNHSTDQRLLISVWPTSAKGEDDFYYAAHIRHTAITTCF